MNLPTKKFGYYHGASWMTLDGKVYIVPGFHDEWIQKHPQLANGNKTVLNLILHKRWISIVVYSKDYVEFCINSKKDCEVLFALYDFLTKNKGKWKNALIMPMVEESFIQLNAADLGTKKEFFEKISSANCLD